MHLPSRSLPVVFMLGYCFGWWRREDPLMTRYVYSPPLPPRQQWREPEPRASDDWLGATE